MHLDALFPGYIAKGSCAFRVLRNSDLEVEDEAEDLVREFEVALKRRRRGDVVRLKISTNAPSGLRRLITRELHVEDHEVVEIDGMLGLTDLSELVTGCAPRIALAQFHPAGARTGARF